MSGMVINDMKVGVMMFPTDKGMQPVELATEAEGRGFDSLWFPEHSHIPTSRRTPWGGTVGAPPLRRAPETSWSRSAPAARS